MAEAKEETKVIEKPAEEVAVPQIKYRIRPSHFFDYEWSIKEWDLEVHLPGVQKDHISLKVMKEGYLMKATRGQAEYKLYESFPFAIEPESVHAKYENGLLKAKGKIFDPMSKAHEISVA